MVTDSETFRQPVSKVYDATVKALQNCGFEVTERSSDTIRASSGFSIRSWGEDIQVRLSSTAKGTEVKITSEPKAQLFDWGKSIEDISKILSELKKQLGK